MLVDVEDEKTCLSRLLESVEASERIVLSRDRRPVARLLPYTPDRGPLRPGALQGWIHFADDFDETSEELIQAFEGIAIE